MGWFSKGAAKDESDDWDNAPTGGALGGDCNHHGAASYTEDRTATGRRNTHKQPLYKVTRHHSCQRCGSNWDTDEGEQP